MTLLLSLPGHTKRPHTLQTAKPPRGSTVRSREHELEVFLERKCLDKLGGIALDVQSRGEEDTESDGPEESDDHVVLGPPGPAVHLVIRAAHSKVSRLLQQISQLWRHHWRGDDGREAPELIFPAELQAVLVNLLGTAGCREAHALVGEFVCQRSDSIEDIDLQPQEDHNLNDLVGQTSVPVHILDISQCVVTK